MSSPTTDTTPSIKEANNLLHAGLGKRRITFSNKQGDFNHLKTTLEKEYPKLSSQKGAFELLRADRGGATRPLVPIPMNPNGYGIPYLKNAVSAHAIIYVRPIQSELSQDPPNDSFGMTQVFNSKCLSCFKDIPVQDMKSHVEDCCGQSSKHQKFGSSLSKPSSSIYLTRLSEDVGSEVEKKEVKEILESVSEMQDEKLWETDLELMFPNFSMESIKSAIGKATSLNEAAEILCEDATPKEKHAQDTVTYDSIESLVADFSSNVDDNQSYTLCIDREELWRGALAFYKKALSDKTLLLKDLIIVFKGEEGLDAGAMKVEFFELLLTEIHQRLFEGSQSSKLPVRDSTKGFLLKLAGVIISHSILQGGPAFPVLSPAIYHQLVADDPLNVLAHLSLEDIPRTAGKV